MTILFKKDWEKYPNAIIDTQTRNKSFIRLAALYREMGVENNAFILQLHNPALQGVDPHDPDLSVEMMGLIAIECKENFFFFIREVMRVPGGTEDDPIPFIANRGNIALFWLFSNHIPVMLIQPRQTGKSFSTDTLMRYLMNIRCTKTEVNLLTKDDRLRAANLERLKNIEHELPAYLRLRTRNDIANSEELTIKALGNTYRGHLPNKSPKAALNVGRGLTSPIFHIDEAPFCYNIGITLPAALAAGTAARNLAKRKNEPYGNIFTTTAGKKDDRDGLYVFSLLINSAVWTEKFFDCDDLDHLEEIIRKNTPRGEMRVNCTFSHRQLGYTDEWLAEALENALASGEDADRDFFNIWTSGSQLSPIPVHMAEIIRASEVKDYYNEICQPYSYIIRWFIPEYEINQRMASGNFIAGLDTSEAGGDDDIALVIRDVRTGETIAVGNYNETNLIKFSEWLFQLMVRFPKLILIPERRSTGGMIIDYLLLMMVNADIDPFARIYNKVVQEAVENKPRFDEINKPMYARSADVYIKYKKTFGFATSAVGATSRTELYSTTLMNSVKTSSENVKDPLLINQILALIIKNGRVDHPDGGNDDLCIAWLLAYWLMTQGKNLSFYGITSREILIANQINQADNDPLAIYKRREEESLRIQVQDLVDKLKGERDEFAAYRIEAELKSKASKLSDTDRQLLSVDDLINTLKENRKSTQNRNRLFRYY